MVDLPPAMLRGAQHEGSQTPERHTGHGMVCVPSVLCSDKHCLVCSRVPNRFGDSEQIWFQAIDAASVVGARAHLGVANRDEPSGRGVRQELNPLVRMVEGSANRCTHVEGSTTFLSLIHI